MAVCAAKICIQRKLCGSGCRMSNCQGNTKNGVCTKATLVGSAVKLNHCEVKTALVLCVHADNEITNLSIDMLNCLQDALAKVAALVAIAKLNSLKLAGGSTGRNDCTAKGAVIENNFNLNGWVAAGIEDFTCVDIINLAHSSPFYW